MRTHQVQVDNDVFEFVKANAEPLVDDFNSALRRLLSLKGTQPQTRPPGAVVRATTQGRVLPALPTGTPVALRHILEVAQLVRGGAYTRTAATQFVAKQDNVFPQTVIDKYCRQLGLTASQFDRLLEEENLNGLRKLLKAKFNERSDVIDQFAK
jgi:hypothetical protein